MRLIALSFALVMSVVTLSFSDNVAYAAPTKVNNKSVKMVKILPGDSLSKIATENGSTAQRLYDANTTVKNPDLIYPGDKLRIPSAEEQLVSRPMPTITPAVVHQSPTVNATPAPSPRASTPVNAPSVSSGSVWDQLAQCEAGGNWSINTGNGYYGGLQFSISSWRAVGGNGLPSDASRDEQIMRGQMLQAKQGWGAWPACSAKLGLR